MGVWLFLLCSLVCISGALVFLTLVAAEIKARTGALRAMETRARRAYEQRQKMLVMDQDAPVSTVSAAHEDG